MRWSANLNSAVIVSCMLLCLPLGWSATAAEPYLEVRLQTHLTSYSSPPGTRFRCVVIREFRADGHVKLARGTLIYGTVTKRNSVNLGFRHERAALEVSFDEYETADGKTHPLEATLATIDNAREEVTAKGRIKGVLAANTPGNLLNGFWAKPTSNLAFRPLVGLTGAANQVWLRYSMGPWGAAALFALRCAIVPFPEPEIILPSGTDITLRVKNAAAMPDAEGIESDSNVMTSGVSEMMRMWPDWATAKLGTISYQNGQPAPDLFNIVLAGSRQQIVAAFLTSGWVPADPRSLTSSSRMYQAFSAMRNYASAPVSTLLYHGAAPDLVFEKSLDTVTQRHHIRFWNVGTLDGNEIWLGAATHDTGLKFKTASFAFSHKIDRNIDNERDKVSTDLAFTGCSGAPVFLNSPVRVSPSENSLITTDGRLVLLTAQSCATEPDFDGPPKLPGNRFTRITRRVVLETRNYLMRDNAYYWGYRVIRSTHNHAVPLLH